MSASQTRTNDKLGYARIHVEELATYQFAASNDAWENAHQESCCFHLAGAVEAILHEVNEGYGLGLALTDVKWGTVRSALKNSGQSSPAFTHLETLRQNPNSWLSLLFELRNHGTHRQRVPKILNINTSKHVDNEFTDPRTGAPQTVYPGLGCLDLLRQFAQEVEALIQHCRNIDSKL